MTSKQSSALITILLLIICLFFIGIGIYAITEAREIFRLSNQPMQADVKPHYEAFKDGYSLAQTFFLIAAGFMLVALLLPRLQSFSFGGMSVTLRELTEKVDAIAQQQNLLQESSVGETGGGKHRADGDLQVLSESPAPMPPQAPAPTATYPDDPQKGHWGGLSKVGSRQLNAEVTRSLVPGLYQVILTVRSLDRNDPLKGMVTFHLHDSFRNQHPVIAVVNGEAVLKLTSVYGAFTVGAEADGGKTKLELDMAELPLPFEDFLSR